MRHSPLLLRRPDFLAAALVAVAVFATVCGGSAASGQSLATLSPSVLGMVPIVAPAVLRAAPAPAPALFPRPALAGGSARTSLGSTASSFGPAASSPGGSNPGRQCRQAIRAAETAAHIPDQLMAAIARIESGRREADGSVNPWPWSINVEGTDHIFQTKAEAIASVRALQARGVRSIDVGCMQVNLMYHADAFASLEQAFDPAANATYAARFLLQLRDQTGTWPTATAWYHSATPELGADYQRKVMAVWPEEMRHKQDTARDDLASAWAATRPAAPAIPGQASPGQAPVGLASLGLASLGIGSAGGLPPGNRASAGRILPLAAGAAVRGLAAYRAIPIPLALRPAPAAPISNRG